MEAGSGQIPDYYISFYNTMDDTVYLDNNTNMGNMVYMNTMGSTSDISNFNDMYNINNFNMNNDMNMDYMNNMNMMNSQKYNKSGVISILFKQEFGYFNKISINCNLNEKISEVINRYRKKANDYYQNESFINSGRELCPSLTVHQSGITENSSISVCKTYDVIGGGGFCNSFTKLKFTDVSKNEVKQLKLIKNGPSWRYVSAGLNIFGNCENKKCIAYNQEVVYRTNYFNEVPVDGYVFNMNQEQQNIRCPICYKIIEPKTCGFWKCEYQFIGKKKVDGEIEKYESKPKETQGENFEYFDAIDNGETIWYELSIRVSPRQETRDTSFSSYNGATVLNYY